MMPEQKRKTPLAKRRSGRARARVRKWVHRVKTVSTFPPEGTFTRDAESIARTMASQEVSPKGLGSAIRMIQFFINRAGRGLSKERRRQLERAKQILRERRGSS